MSHQLLKTAILAAIQASGYRLNETIKDKVDMLSYDVIDENDTMADDEQLADMQTEDDEEDEE